MSTAISNGQSTRPAERTLAKVNKDGRVSGKVSKRLEGCPMYPVPGHPPPFPPSRQDQTCRHEHPWRELPRLIRAMISREGGHTRLRCTGQKHIVFNIVIPWARTSPRRDHLQSLYQSLVVASHIHPICRLKTNLWWNLMARTIHYILKIGQCRGSKYPPLYSKPPLRLETDC